MSLAATEQSNTLRRVIVNGCCENFILDYRVYLTPDHTFECPVCVTTWLKADSRYFVRLKDSEAFNLSGPEHQLQLTPVSPQARFQTRKCCVDFMLKYGTGLRSTTSCPICKTGWRRVTQREGEFYMSLARQVRFEADYNEILLKDGDQLYTLRQTPFGLDLWFERQLEER